MTLTDALPAHLQAYALQPHEGERVDNLGLRLLATGRQTQNTLTVAVVTNPGPGGPPMHTHFTVDELYYVLRGRYRFRLGDQDHECGPGGFVYVPHGTSHTFAAAGTEEAQLLCVTLPDTEDFLRGIAALQEGGMDQQHMLDHFHNFQTEIDGPPLPVTA